ncbi:MAG: HAD-IC family P-type ATPase [Lachnospiraceae bacterium]|nr:HAD-IC family P-type ATPase [Lachnospiraceae bacterium]
MFPKGLSTEEVRALTAEGKNNTLPDRVSKTVPQIIAAQVFTYFNAIFALLAVLLILTGSFRSLTFLPVVIANTLIGIIQQLRSKKVLDELALLDVSEYRCLRDGEEKKVSSDQLVLGDVIRLEIGQQIPADAVVLDGEAGVNESLLTGEEDEVEKKEGSELKSGSFLTAGSLTARLTRVGAESYAAQLTAKAKEIKDKTSEMIRDIETIIRVAGIAIIPVGVLLLYQAVAVNGLGWKEGINSMVGAVIGMIPEGMYLLMTMALALSAMRLAKQKVLLHDMRSIETLARVDVLCLDKTGTITSPEMEVSETFLPADLADRLSPEETAAQRERARNLLSSYLGSMTDSNITMEALRAYFPAREAFENAAVQPFNSRKKYSQIDLFGISYRLGAPEYLLSPEQREINRTVIEQRAGAGQRVLAFTEEKEADARPILFVALHNAIRENARETFAGFAAQGVTVKVISGDNPMTVSRVAAEAEIVNAEQYIDATTLDSEEKIRDAATAYTVFGRVSPEQKKSLVLAMKDKGLKVAMSGDGVNDILAMKEADCSVAMGGGSDAARQAAQVVLLDSDFSHMRGIVSEGRRDINNITRSATLFLYKNIFSLLTALFAILLTASYPLRPAQVSLISGFNIGIPAFLLALEPNEKKQQGRFIRNTLVRSLPASVTAFLAINAMVLLADRLKIPAAEVGTACTYLLAMVGFFILFSISRPLNKYRVAVILLSMLGFFLSAAVLNDLFELVRIQTRTLGITLLFVAGEFLLMSGLTRLLEKETKE